MLRWLFGGLFDGRLATHIADELPGVESPANQVWAGTPGGAGAGRAGGLAQRGSAPLDRGYGKARSRVIRARANSVWRGKPEAMATLTRRTLRRYLRANLQEPQADGAAGGAGKTGVAKRVWRSAIRRNSLGRT